MKGLAAIRDTHHTTSAPLFPRVDTPYAQYMHDVAAALRRELADFPEGRARHGLERRATSLLYCGSSVEGYVCDHCGEALEASGAFYDPIGSYGRRRQRCHSRVCPRCARRRSAEMKAWGRRLKAKIGEIPDGWSWKFVTLTAPYDATSDVDLSYQSLRARWNGYRKAWRAVWAHYKAKCCDDRERKAIGAMAAVELAGTGNVHLHCLFLGPWIDEDVLGDVARKAYPRIGFVRVQMADPRSIDEVCKYPIDTKGGAAESWLGGGRALRPEFEWQVHDGERVKVWTGRRVPCLVHPTLAARWEIALYGRRILDTYGSFRGVEKASGDAVREHPRADCLPEECHCGAVHPWYKVVEPTAKWISRFAGTGKKALFTPRALARRRERECHAGSEVDRE